MNGKDRIVLALDVPTQEAALSWAERLGKHVGWFKVGRELLDSTDFGVLDELAEAGAENLFADVKIKDIPRTAAAMAKVPVQHGATMLNLHCTGGYDMMCAVVEAARREAERIGWSYPYVIGVTLLTSISEKALREELLVPMTPLEYVVHLAKLAQKANLDGVVASPLEAAAIREACGPNFKIVTPGVRSTGTAIQDQARTDTPAGAVKAGSNLCVIGRPILEATDPVAAAIAIGQEINLVLKAA